MLRNISKAFTTKQALVADQTSLSSPTKNPPSPISSFLNSPGLFNVLLPPTQFSDTETHSVVSPSSVLDTQNNLDCVNPTILSELSTPYPRIKPTAQHGTQAIGLALIDSIIQENCSEGGLGNFSKPVNRAVLFGSKLRLQILDINPIPSIPQNKSPKSPCEFGIKTVDSPVSSPPSSTPVKHLSRQLSLKEMELSEDYTCVISHGPNPKITHIFDNSIVERRLGDRCGLGSTALTHKSPDFLSVCHTCKNALRLGKDIYIYRGEKAFCSHECRCQEMFFEGLINPDLDG